MSSRSMFGSKRNRGVKACVCTSRASGVFLLGVLLSAASVYGQVSISLVPQDSGPFLGGETVTVDVVAKNPGAELPIVYAQLDFTDTDAALGFPNDFNWLLVPVASGIGTMPVPTWSEGPPAVESLPAMGSIRLGSIDVRLPNEAGCYVLDCLNADDERRDFGARFDAESPKSPGLLILRAFSGDIIGGQLTLGVGQELCNGIDDDCDGLIDEDFFREVVNPVDGSITILGPGDPCYTGVGDCAGPGRLACTKDGTDIECIPGQIIEPGTEGPYGDKSCEDFRDNDCDGLADYEDPDCTGPEKCDSFDNDNDGMVDEDFPGLGDVCNVGQGICAKEGIIVCLADGSGTRCNAEPGVSVHEGPPGAFRCRDGLDDDCDGLVDMDDPDCQEPERCDGVDNDGDGMTDEDFPELGTPCEVGLGECHRSGVIICNAMKDGTVCSAQPGKPQPEGPGCDCGDGLDNDCDGLIDLDDPNCGGHDLRVQCALPATCAFADGDCMSRHTADWQVLNGDGSETVFAELVALDASDQFLASIPIQKGDEVRMASRVNAVDFRANTSTVNYSLNTFSHWAACETGPDGGPIDPTCWAFESDCDDDIDLADMAEFLNKFGTSVTMHELYAPQVFMRVNASNKHNSVDAVCSNMPLSTVVMPQQQVFNANGTPVRAVVTIPRVDTSSLFLKLDGVDVFAQLGLDPATDFPGGPYGGEVQLEDCTVEICDLIVDAGGLDEFAANTMTMTINGLCCGEHWLVSNADPTPGVYPEPLSPACFVDDLRAKGNAIGFSVEITSPQEGELAITDDVTVKGRVCHGLPVICPFRTFCDPQVKLNGLWLPLQPPVVTVGDGENTGNKYEYAFEHNMTARTLDQNAIPGATHRGQGLLYAEAIDELGNSANSEKVGVFIGPNQPAPSATASTIAGTDPTIANGTALSISQAGLDKSFSALVESTVPPAIETELAQWLDKFQGFETAIPMPLHLNDWHVLINPVPGSAGLDPGPISVVTTLEDGAMKVTTTLPDFVAQIGAKGDYRVTACGPWGKVCICVATLTLDGIFEIRVMDPQIVFSINEDDILQGNSIPLQFLVGDNAVDVTIVSGGLDIGCIAGFVFDLVNVLADIVNFASKVITFGQWDPGLELGLPLEENIESLDFQSLLSLINADPLSLEFFQIADAPLPAFGTTLGFSLDAVEIIPQGMTLSYGVQFKPTSQDAEVAPIYGTPATAAPIPLPPIPAASDITVALADDVFNQLLYSMTYTGALKTEFDDSQLLQDLLPADCNSAGVAANVGQCEGLKGTNCGTLVDPDAAAACVQAQTLSGFLHIGPTTPMLLHGRVDVPPKLVLVDNPATPNVVEGVLRIDQLSVALLADRDGDALLDPEFNGDYDAVPDCQDAPFAVGQTCRLWDTCYDINFDVELSLSVSGGVPSIGMKVVGRSLSHGSTCGSGGGTPLPGSDGIDSIAQGVVLDKLEQAVTSGMPPLELKGLDFGGIINFANPDLIQIENDGDPTQGDYLGATGQAGP